MDDRSQPVQGLVEQLQAGASREEAFRRLFDLYSPRLHHFFSRRGFPPQDCLDLTQETFLGIYRGVGGFRRDASFETWLFRIATNAYRKHLRWGSAGKREGAVVALEDAGGTAETLAAADGPVPGEEMLARERSRLLRQAIERLPEQMRKCLILRIDQELKYREIAKLMRLSPETVKVHLFKARRRLQEELGPYFQDPALAKLEETS